VKAHFAERISWVFFAEQYPYSFFHAIKAVFGESQRGENQPTTLFT
jgi:hypothetical protein